MLEGLPTVEPMTHPIRPEVKSSGSKPLWATAS